MRQALLSLVVAVALVGVACGGDEETQPEPTAPPTEQVAPTREARPPPGPAPTPAVTEGRFEFPEHGYAAAIPEGWTPSFNLVIGPPVTTDAFFGTQEDEVQPNISVTCETLEPDMSLETYLEIKLLLVEELMGITPEPQPFQVAGRDAFIFQYSRTNPPFVDRTEVVLVNERCGWSMAINVPQGQGESFRPIFDAFISSVQLLLP